MKRKSILTLIATLVLSGVVLTGCGSDSEEISETGKDIIIAEDASTKDNKQSSFKNWKKYCLTDEFLNEEFEYDEWLEDFEDASEEDDFNIDEWKEYNIVDVNDDGVPEILTKTSIISFYDLINGDADVKEPERFEQNPPSSCVYYFEESNMAIFPNTSISLENPCVYICRNWLDNKQRESLEIEFETAMQNGTYNRTGNFNVFYNSYHNDKSDVYGISASEAIALANEFAGVDITSLQPADYPYTLGELVEALRNY